MGVLSRDHHGRKKCDYSNLEFFKPYIESVYNPVFTLNELIETNQIKYKNNVLIETFSESQNEVWVKGVDLTTSSEIQFKCRKLILAASALNSTRIVLKSLKLFNRPTHFQENAISYIPYLNIRELGSELEENSYPSACFLSFYKSKLYKNALISSFYGISGPLNSDLIFDFPLSFGSSIQAMRLLKAALFIQQVFYPGDPTLSNAMRLDEAGKVHFNFKSHARGQVESEMIRLLRPLGLLSAPFLCKYPDPGNSFHYGCTLPMREMPGPLESYKDGKLFGTKNVYIGDAANFSMLPAKNYSFTIMANSMRIARLIREG
ncbi:MAG: hypothetical protein IPK04_06550 [Bdellovibrionales bacterium]|nr:hypothetical protein [Bdellovibrionales bacterium]